MIDMKPVKKLARRKYDSVEFFKFAKDKEERYELINGQIRMMASPTVIHQDIAGYIYRKLGDFLEGKTCRAFIAPLDVVLFFDEKDKDRAQNVFQPDVFVVCDPGKISGKRICGAPDFVAEIVSESSETNDYLRKFAIYMSCGVKEYWIINPETKEIMAYTNTEEKEEAKRHTFADKIKIGIFGDFEIDFNQMKI